MSCRSLTTVLAWLCVALGGSAWAHQAIDAQILDVTERISAAPEDATLYLRRGELHRVHQDWELAVKDYGKARELDPELAEVDLCQGRMQLEAGEWAAARESLDRYLVVHPDHVVGLATRARARARLGDNPGAAADFTAALATTGGGRPQPGYYLERARALVAAGDEHLDQAIRGLDEGLERLGKPVTLQLLALELETRAGRYDAALERLQGFLERAKRKETWLVRRAEVLEAAGRPEEARASYVAALEAIEALSVGRRRSRAVTNLENEARAAVAGLTTAANKTELR